MKKIIKIIKSDFQDTTYGLCQESPNAGCAQIKIKNFGIKYGNDYALRNLNLELQPCVVNAIVGPSGCGKSSLLSAFNRICDLNQNCKTEGEILIGKTNVLDPKCNLFALRKRVGMIFQKPTPFPLSIRKNIEVPLKEHGIKSKDELEEVLIKALKSVGLWEEVKDRLNNSALTLSGGQQQRLCMARTLALKPEVILMDEPCSALDPISTRVIEDLIISLKGRYTIVLVTHNLAQAERTADYVSFFWHKDGEGRLVEHGTTKEIFEAPKDKLTARYISSQR